MLQKECEKKKEEKKKDKESDKVERQNTKVKDGQELSPAQIWYFYISVLWLIAVLCSLKFSAVASLVHLYNQS